MSTLYTLSWESVSAIHHPQYYDFATERVRSGLDLAAVPEEHWHSTSRDTDAPHSQLNGLRQLRREGELIRKIKLERFEVAREKVETEVWEP